MVSIDACIELLKQEFEKDEMIAQVQEFLKRASFSPKWMLYSDYCLDDKNKPNDVLSFVLIPFISEEKYHELERLDHRRGREWKPSSPHERRVGAEYPTAM